MVGYDFARERFEGEAERWKWEATQGVRLNISPLPLPLLQQRGAIVDAGDLAAIGPDTVDVISERYRRERAWHLEQNCIETDKPATWADKPGMVEYECGATIDASPPSGRPLPTQERVDALRALHEAQQAAAHTSPVSADIVSISATDLGVLGLTNDTINSGCLHYSDVAETVVCLPPEEQGTKP